MRWTFSIIFYCLLFSLLAQDPVASFSSIDTGCIKQRVEFANSSMFADSFQWDFCAGELSTTPTGINFLSNTELNLSFDLELVEDSGEWFGFLTSRTEDAALSLSFGTDLRSEPLVGSLPNTLGLVDPNAISIYQDSSLNWFGLVITIGDSRLVQLNFGDSLNGVVSEEEIFGLGLYEGNRDITSVTYADSLFVFVGAASSGSLVRIRGQLSDSLKNFDSDTLIIASYTQVNDIQFIRENNSWYGLSTSFGDNRVSKLSFGSSLSNDPVITDISGTFSSPTKAEIVIDGGEYFGFIQLRGGSIVRLDFGESMANDPEFTDLGNLGLLPSNSFAYAMGKNGTEWTGYGIGFTNNALYQIAFENDCSSDIDISGLFEPVISYSSSGRKYVQLEARDEEGLVSYFVDSIEVLSDEAPMIFFTVDASRCIANTNSFTPSLGGLTSYSWDFDGNGTEDSSLENPTFDYSSSGSGTYTVRLDVNDGTCDNFYEEEITIYDEPPVPSFTVTSSGSFCTNNELILTNITDETGYDDVLTYQWVIDGDVVDQKDTVYTFNTSGVKAITLQSFVPGCSSAITSEDIAIAEGPEVGFSYSNNCFGEAIQFTSEVIGENITDYAWDFGDGEGTSSRADTVYQYTAVGTYTVQLTVTNVSGCETTYEEDIEVNDNPLVDFTIGEAIENLPVTFTGTDLTLTNDSIVSWSWDFAGLGTSSSRDTSYVFSEGSYTVGLSIATAQGCADSITKQVLVDGASCPAATFDVSDELCQGQEASFVNQSVNGASYAWDLCVGELNSIPATSSIQTNGDYATSFDIAVTYSDEGWYGFVSSRNGLGSVLRLNYGDSLRSTPTISSLPNASGISGPNGFSTYEYGGSWYGLLINNVDSRLLRYSFGGSLSNEPSEELLLDIGLYEGNTDVTSQVDGDSVYVFVPSDNNNSIVRLKYKVDNPSVIAADTITVSGFSEVTDIQLIRECDSWYGLITSFPDSKVSKLDFGTSLSATPTVTGILGSFASATKAELVADGANYYGFVQLRGGDLVRISFGESMNNAPEVTNLGNLGVLPSNSFAFSMGKDSSEWTAYGIGFSDNTLYQISFPDDCSASKSESTAFEPSGVSYSTSGRKYISLKATDADGHVDYYLDSVDVTGETAPDISFSIDESRCITNANTFTPTTTGLTSYSWDFNNDGIEDSNEESPQVLFDTLGGAGTYTVRLDVSDGSCANFYEEQITIYNPPPSPSYDVSASSYCIGVGIGFNNTTDDTSYSGPLSYLWEFIDEETSTTVGTSDERDPTFSFATSGTKTVILTSSIPGCEETTQQIITINPGPTSDFSANATCQNESMQFTNSSLDADSYFWDFGDGFTSTAENPSHVFGDAGNYSVSLTSTDTSGCDNTIINEVSVSSSPQPAFDFDIPCTSEDGTQFFDLSTVVGADIVSWRWDVDGVEESTQQNPIISFESPGSKTIGLTVTSSNGCETYLSEDIEILMSPQPNFDVSIGCQGEETIMTDNTLSSGNPIVSWLWSVNGETYTTQDITHVFDESGVFEVSLEVTGQNFCTEAIVKSIEILELPTVDFTVIGQCDNQLIQVEDQSTEGGDEVISRRWMLNGENVGNGSQLFLNNLDDATYDLSLEIETSSGCITSDTETLEINTSPTAAFSSSATYGLPSDQITFTNNSVGAVAYQWLLNGAEISNSPDTQSIAFSEAGTHLVSLVAQNSMSCTDTISQEILIAIPEVDLAVGSLDLVNENGVGKILLNVQNLSNLPVEMTEVQIVLENQFSVTEQIVQFIGVGESALVGLNVGIPLQVSEPAYFCVSLSSQYTEFEDINPINNEKCLTIQPEVKVESPFPNPVTDRFRLKVVTPTDGAATVSLINSAGKVEQKQNFNSTQGLNNFFFDMSTLNPGIYFVVVEISGNKYKRKVIKL